MVQTAFELNNKTTKANPKIKNRNWECIDLIQIQMEKKSLFWKCLLCKIWGLEGQLWQSCFSRAELYRGGPCFPYVLFILAGLLSVCGTAVKVLGSGLSGFLFLFFCFGRADEFAGVWVVASVALRGPAIYQTEALSAGSIKGKETWLTI